MSAPAGNTSHGYSDEFFAGNKINAARSAGHLVPLVLNLVQPKSVVDIGCGTGDFLAEVKARGVAEILGVDGEWARPDAIHPDEFMKADLGQPLNLNRRFDLAMSLEVAEHLPPSSAGTFVDSLVRLSPCVLFSAAIPHQGGVQHLNEQWPEYWSNQFARHDYVAIDCIRDHVWQNPNVQWWYAQNTVLYVRADQSGPVLARVQRPPVLPVPRRLVHPQAYLNKVAESAGDLGVATTLRLLPGLALRAVRKRLGAK